MTVTAPPGATLFRLDAADVTYAMGVDARGCLQPLHWGPLLAPGDPLEARVPAELSGFDPVGSITPQEFAGQGEGLVTDAGLKVAFDDGSRDLALRYRAHRVEQEGLVVTLADIVRPLTVELLYRIDPATGVLARSARVMNDGDVPVRIDVVASALFTLPAADDYRIDYLSGRHAAEWTLTRAPVGPAPTVLESRRGSTGHGNQPWFAIGRESLTGEEHGPVWFGALAWSGSFRLSIGQDALGRVRIAGGINPHDFSWLLRPGEAFETPVLFAGFVEGGRGEASRRFHAFQLARLVPGGEEAALRPVLYNSWEATAFDVTAAGQMALAEKAARIGVERFVVDDGWFGARDGDRAGLGDWTVNRTKFPDGLDPLIARVKALGMDFGLWVEPEMVNVDSDLWRAHPDWVLAWPGRPRTEGRHQLVLNLARDDVRDHLLDVLDRLLGAHDIAFLKWDYNRNWTEPGWQERAPEDQQRVHVDFVRNLYRILGELRRRHLRVEIEACSGGGGRVDLGILPYSDQVWTSDNTDPAERLIIQDGFTRAYAPAVMMAWVTDSPNWANGRETSLDYRFLSAMQGGLGVGANLDDWDDADFATAARWIAAYKRVRRTVQRGRLHRLRSPSRQGGLSATLYVGAGEAVLFQMQQGSMFRDDPAPVRLRGLDPACRYRVSRLGGGVLPDTVPPVASGAWWMAVGLTAPLRGDHLGMALLFEAC